VIFLLTNVIFSVILLLSLKLKQGEEMQDYRYQFEGIATPSEMAELESLLNAEKVAKKALNSFHDTPEEELQSEEAICQTMRFERDTHSLIMEISRKYSQKVNELRGKYGCEA